MKVYFIYYLRGEQVNQPALRISMANSKQEVVDNIRKMFPEAKMKLT